VLPSRADPFGKSQAGCAGPSWPGRVLPSQDCMGEGEARRLRSSAARRLRGRSRRGRSRGQSRWSGCCRVARPLRRRTSRVDIISWFHCAPLANPRLKIPAHPFKGEPTRSCRACGHELGRDATRCLRPQLLGLQPVSRSDVRPAAGMCTVDIDIFTSSCRVATLGSPPVRFQVCRATMPIRSSKDHYRNLRLV
jgi:hypothetical protein